MFDLEKAYAEMTQEKIDEMKRMLPELKKIVLSTHGMEILTNTVDLIEKWDKEHVEGGRI